MYQKEANEVLKLLKTTTKGLSSHEAEQRLHKHGYNELKKSTHIKPFTIFLQQFTSPLVWILIAALIFSVIEHSYIDATVIGIIIVLNATLGFVQEYKAEKAIEALQKMASSKATVIRNNWEIKIDSKLVVPGDILILQTGDKVPADARLIEVHDLQTQEGPLTGESLPVNKITTPLTKKTALADRVNMVYATTTISNGRAKAVVTETGMSTEVGKVASLIEAAHEKLTPLQKKLRVLGKKLTIAVVVVAIIVFIAGLLTGQPATTMFLAAIALAVAAIPEGLPTVITISLAIGVQRMVKKNALVRKLPSVETLGSVNVICTDKTGTLTHNEMTVTKIWANNKVYTVTGSGYETKGTFSEDPKVLTTLLTIGLNCNDASFQKKQVTGDPTEAALIIAAQKAGITETPKRTNEIPFSSERKMMTTFHNKVSYTKGAPDIIINQCNRILINGKVQRLNRTQKQNILQQNEQFASQALRVLGFAYNENKTAKTAEQDMVFVGLQAMIDPPRTEVKAAIKRCQEAGIRVIMITGDQIATAQAIAKELGITGEAMTGQELENIKNLKTKIKTTSIFARVNPEHKLKIVNTLKELKHVVAMTGDGVNDAPALKKSDIGIAMGITGTDVAKEASDMILTDDNFTSIVNAVEEGRGIFDNIRKFVNYLLSSNLAEILVIFLGMTILAPFFGLGIPLTAIQILWVNLVTDGLPAVALGVDPHQKDIMKRPPRNTKEGIISGNVRRNIFLLGTTMAVIILVLFWLYRHSSLAKAQTIAFTSLVVFEIVRLYLIRKEYKLGAFSNKYLVGAVAISLLLQFLVLYTPLRTFFGTVALELIDWIWILLAAGILIIITKIIDSLYKKVPT